jgi:GAF domain-containing protein
MAQLQRLPDIPFDNLTERVARAMQVATADGAGQGVDNALAEVLRMLRDHMKMDVVFVSQFTGGRREFRWVVTDTPVIQPGDSDPIEQSWCQRVVLGRLPELIEDASVLPRGLAPQPDFPIGTHLSTPIVMRDGRVYGTLCCFSFGVNEEVTQQNLRQLRYAARLAARTLDQEQVMRQLSRQAAASGGRAWIGKTA